MRGLPVVFTRTQANAAGLSDRVLQGPRVQRVFRGVYAEAGLDLDLRLRARAALLIAPTGAVVARQTAAVLLGGVVPADTRVHLRLPAGRIRVPGIIDRTRSGEWPTARIGGLPVTTAEDTFLDLAGELGLVDLVVLGDALVRRRRTTVTKLVAAAAQASGRHVALARRAAGLVRAGVDSPMESRLRMLLVLAGLPEPVVNHTEHDDPHLRCRPACGPARARPARRPTTTGGGSWWCSPRGSTGSLSGPSPESRPPCGREVWRCASPPTSGGPTSRRWVVARPEETRGASARNQPQLGKAGLKSGRSGTNRRRGRRCSRRVNAPWSGGVRV